MKLTADEAGEQLNAIAYRFSEDAMIQVYDRLNQSPMHLTSWKDTKLSGTVSAAKAGMLFTSIPFDKGWTVKVDGEKVETRGVRCIPGYRCERRRSCDRLLLFPGGLKDRRSDLRRIHRDPDPSVVLRREMDRREAKEE